MRVIRYAVLFLLVLIGCHEPSLVSEPIKIPERSLSEPSALAYDTRRYYVADWMAPGVIAIAFDGKVEQVAGAGKAIIQTVAVGVGELLLEDNEGQLFFWSALEPQKLSSVVTEVDRPVGAPICWDGAYVWSISSGQARAAVLLARRHLAAVPREQVDLAAAFSPQEQVVSLACGWNRSVALSRYHDGYILTHDVLASEVKVRKDFWSDKERTPVAVTLREQGKVEVLAADSRKQGSYILLPWN